MITELLSRNPLLIVFDIIAIMVAIGCLVMLLREVRIFRGYAGFKGIARRLARKVNGKVFRDGDDLGIHGFHRGLPVVIRFSKAENTPAVNLWMKVASRFNFFIFHSSSSLNEGRFKVPSGDSTFDRRFVIRTDDRESTIAFLSDPKAVEELKQLACGQGTSVALGTQSLELSEATTPADTYAHVTAHLDTLARVAVRVGAISQVSKKAKIYMPDRYILARVALAVLVIAGMVEVWSAAHGYEDKRETTAPTATGPKVVMSEDDVPALPSIERWKLAEPTDFDTTLSTWFRDHNREVKTRFDGEFGGSGQEPTTAYVFHGDADKENWRVALLSQHRPVFDASFKNVVAVVRVPKSVLDKVEWKQADPSTGTPDGDGLMIVRQNGADQVATVLTLRSGKVEYRVPNSVYAVGVER